MHRSLSEAKKDLAWLKREKQAKLKKQATKFSQQLEYKVPLDKSTALIYRIVYYPEPDTMGCYYGVERSKKKKEKTSEIHSFHDIVDNKPLPGIVDSDLERLREMYRYNMKDNLIISEVDPMTQVKNMTEIIKNNHDSIVSLFKIPTKDKKASPRP